MGRAEGNNAIEALEELVDVVQQLCRVLYHPNRPQPIFARTRFTSGQQVHKKGEWGEMEGVPPPHYSDPTGDEAVFDEKTDRTAITILGITATLHAALARARWVLALSDTDVTKRAQQSVPDCLACGDPCVGRVLSGFDEKCYKRWTRSGRPDRAKFIFETQRSKESATQAGGASE